MAGGSEPKPIDLESIERFLRLAVKAGTINWGTALRLSELARSLSAPPGPAAAAPLSAAAPPPPPPGAGAAAVLARAEELLASPDAARLRPEAYDDLSREAAWLRRALRQQDGDVVAAVAPRLAATLASARRSLAETRPAPAVPRPPRPPEVPAPAARPVAPAPAPPPPAPRPLAGPTWTERAGRRLGALRRAVGSDFAIHGITYLGVFLALVVLVVFFTVDDYFGRTFSIPWTRPFIFMVFPALFFVLAWVLRHRSGIPQAALAIELIGAVLVPAMVAALFRDGFWFPPNVEQLGRWVMYAGSALPALFVFWWLARRRRLYAYLVAPTLWTMAGALGLYLHFHWVEGGDRAMPEGVSAYQVVLILAVMALSVLVANLIRETELGRLVSAPTVRAAVVLAPFVLVVAIQFAYSDALVEGLPGTEPGLEQMDLPVALAAAATGALYLFARGSGYAWAGLSERVGRDFPGAIAVLGGVTLAVASGLGFADAVPLSWVGVILCATGVALAALERIPGYGNRAGSWTGAATGLGGLMMSLGGGGATLAAWGLAAVTLAAFPRAARSLFRAAPAAESVARLSLWVTTLVALGAGAGRLAWPEGTAWVLVGSATLLAGTKRVAALPAGVRSLAHLPAAILVAAALGVVAARAASGSGPGYALSGGVVLAAAVAVFLLDAPWVWRLLPGTALLVAGGLVEVHPALEAGAWVGAAADAAVLGGLGLLLVALALFPRSGGHAVWHAALGHLLMAAALIRSLPDERSALVGVGLFFAAHAAEAAAVELGGSALAGRPGFGAVWKVMPAGAAAAALPCLTVLAWRRIPAVAAQVEHSGLVLAGTALVLAAATAWARKRSRLRAVEGVAATMVALAGIGLAVPSAGHAVAATGAATVATAVVALSCRLPWASGLPWAGATATFLLALWHGGLEPLDLRYGMVGAGALLVAGPAVVNWRRGRPTPALGPWLWPPLLVGLSALAVAVGFGLARPRLLWVIALATAGVLAFAGWGTRVGGAALPVAAATAIGYAHLLQDEWPVFEDGVRWMPLAGALVIAAALLPGRRAWRVLTDPSPGTLLAGLTVAGLGVEVGAVHGEETPALLCLSGVLAAVWATRRAEAWLYAAVAAAFVGGLAAAPEWWWLAATAAADAVVLGILAVRRAEQRAGRRLAWMAAALAAIAFGSLIEWGAWATVPLLAASASAAAVSLGAATVLGLPRSWAPGAVIWRLPSAALALGAIATLMGQGHARLGPEAFGVDAGALAAAALAAGLVGTGRLWPGLVGSSAALAAAAYGCLGGWQDWSPEMVVGLTAAAGAVLAAGAAWLSLRSGWGPRWLLWRAPLHGLSQVAAVAVAGVAVGEFGVPEGLGVVAAVLAAEAVQAGVIGTVRRWVGLVGASALCLAGAYGCLGAWQQWSPEMVVGVTAVVGAVLAAGATALSYWREAPERLVLWRVPLHGLSQVAAVAVAGVAVGEFGVPEGLGVVAAVLAAEAVLAGAVGTVEGFAALVAASAALAAGAYGCLAGWLGWGTDLVVGVTAAVGAVLAAGATALSYWRAAPAWAGPWRLPLHVLSQAAAIAVAVAAVAGYGPARELSLVAGVCAFEAIWAAANARWMPAGVGPWYLSAEFGAAAVFLALAAVGQTDWPVGPWVQGAAALALLGALGHGLARLEAPWRQPAAVFSGLVAPGAVIAAAWMIGPPHGHTAAAVAFGGADLMAVGLLRRRLLLVESGLVAWVGAGLIAFQEHLDLTSHLTVVPLCVALLVVIEVERGRRRREEREASTPALRLLEWALMLFPPTLCVADAAGDLRFLAVLAAEGAVLMAWGILSEVRRRALLGVGALALVILLAAIIPLSRGARGGITGGTWLAVGAGAAVLLIAIGSLLERHRRRIGRALAAVGRAMEGWE